MIHRYRIPGVSNRYDRSVDWLLRRIFAPVYAVDRRLFRSDYRRRYGKELAPYEDALKY
jgi:hypothetical protein